MIFTIPLNLSRGKSNGAWTLFQIVESISPGRAAPPLPLLTVGEPSQWAVRCHISVLWFIFPQYKAWGDTMLQMYRVQPLTQGQRATPSS